MNQLPSVPVSQIRQLPADPGTGGFRIDLGAVAAAQRAPSIDVRSFAASEAAIGAAFGNAAQGLSEGMSRIAEEQFASINRRKIDEAGAKLTAANDQIASLIANEPDETKWPQIFASESVKWESELMADKTLSPAARAAIGSKISGWKITTESNVRRTAFNRSIQKEAEGLEGSRITAMHGKDWAAAENITKQQEARGLIGADTAAKQRVQAQKFRESSEKEAEATLFAAHEKNIINMAKSGNLDLALKQIEAPGFMGGKAAAQDLESLRNKAQAAWRDRSAVEMESLANDIASGKIANTKAIEAVDSPFITPALKKEAVRMLASQNAHEMALDREENGVANAVKYRRAVKDYDPKSDPDRVKYFSLMHEISGRVEQTSAGEITGELYKKYGAIPPKMAGRPEIQRNISSSLDIVFDPVTGAFPWRSKSKDAEGKEVTKEDNAQRQRALDAQTAVEIKLNDWFRDHPEDAQNLNKAKAKMAELLPEGTRAAALQSLSRLMAPKTAAVKASAPVDADTFRERLPAGLRDHAQDFIDAGSETGLDPYFLAGIAMFETGDGTSPAFRNKNNAMGISNASGPVALPSVRDSILRQARTLARPNGPYAGKETIDEIGAVYAPPGAGNDPNGTNNEWPDGVKSKINRLLGK